MEQAESVDGFRSVALALAALVVTFVATALLYQHKAEPRHSCVQRTAHLEFDVFAHHAHAHASSIVIDVR